MALEPAAVAAVKERIREEPDFAVEVLTTLYSVQTEEEKRLGRDTGIRDGRGFSPVDIYGMCRMVWKLERRGHLTGPERDSVTRCMEKYAGQYLAICIERIQKRKATRQSMPAA